MKNEDIETKLKELPEELKEKVLVFIDTLISSHKNSKKVPGKLKLDWEKGLSDLKEQYTSVELQHSSLNWR